MSGETSLSRLLATMSPYQRPGRYVFVTVDQRPSDVEALANVVEPEGLSLVITQEDADRLDLAYDFLAGWITLQVHSALMAVGLMAVGLTAAVAAALTAAGISCNGIAGYHHDHLLVPLERVEEALAVLSGITG